MNAQHTARVAGILALLAILVATIWLAISTSTSSVSTVYGKRRGLPARSINSTSVFSQLFAAQGATIRDGGRLSPSLSKSNVIVWTPNSFLLPSDQEIDFFEQEWLNLDDGKERTLIYVARDYEAAIEYWRLQAEAGKGTEHIEAIRQLARVQADHAYMRSLTGLTPKCRWFEIENKQHVFLVRPDEGPWASTLEPRQVQLAVSGVLAPAESSDDVVQASKVLLGSSETPLIVEITNYEWPDSRVLVLLNGSSILNYPLVNHQNRKIAAKIIEHCGTTDRVTFLESDASGLIISRSNKNSYSGFEALTVWPINVILLHLIAAGILFCVMVFPIFGRPRELVTDNPSDFGKHVGAIQQLLERAGNRSLALEKVNQYRNLENDVPTKPTQKTETGNPFKVSQA